MPIAPNTTRVILQRLSDLALSLAWFTVLEIMMSHPYPGMIAAAVVMLISMAWVFRRRGNLTSVWSFRIGSFLFLLTSAVALAFMTSPLSKHGLAVLSAVVLYIFFAQAEGDIPDELQGRITTFVMTVSFWFAIMSLLSFGIFVNGKWWQLVIAAVPIYTIIAAVIWLELGVSWLKFRHILPMIAWLGAELMLVAWWLPTSILVGSVVATIIGMLFLHLCRHIWLGTWKPGRGRRYIVIGVTIMLVVLLSARWI